MYIYIIYIHTHIYIYIYIHIYIYIYLGSYDLSWAIIILGNYHCGNRYTVNKKSYLH